eukprot:TRINITY_DN377_c3_g1_i1.p1 TRINITY_DN377_c3_g1~~TRINITY_DN377_c3_g1_i1.p1  ORF type:complete len:199 (+),score=107.33 TRINITY_DN377_c3_g1_i1:80-676(+)
MPSAELNAANPHRSAVRNLRKKMDALKELKQKDESTLDDGQKKKLKGEKKLAQEIAEAESKYDQWEAELGAGAPAAAKPAEEPKPAKKEKLEKMEKVKPKQKASPQASPASTASKPPPPAPAAAAASGDAGGSELDPKEEKKIRNRIKNLRSKLEQIAELKGKEGLNPEQQQKLKTEKKTQQEVDGLVAKLQAFGLKA